MRNRDLPRGLLVVALSTLALVGGCGSSGRQVTRTTVDSQIDLSGEWNDVDSQQVSAALTTQIMNSPWVEDFRAEHGKKPYLIIGQVRNKTSEHIAVKTFVADLERSFINGGRVKVVASADEREGIRDERADQQQFASESTIKKWGQEKGADFMFMGEINAIVDQTDGQSVKYYQVDCYLVDLQDNTKVWAGYEKIKKLVTHGRYGP